jgi:hypothetical protein
MSLTSSAPRAGAVPAAPVRRRVRHQARDVAVLMTFSAGASTGVAVALLVLAHLLRAGR